MTPPGRVLIGPANHAGQAYEWARALREGGVRADSLSVRRRPSLPWNRVAPIRFPADRWLPYPRATTPMGRRRRLWSILGDYTHLALDGFMSVLGSARAELTNRELDVLSARVDRLILIAHGSDVRDPARHEERIADSYFRRMDQARRTMLSERAAHNRSLCASVSFPLLVSTPDLLLDTPDAQWLPLRVDPQGWSAPPAEPGRRPRFLHVPSSGIKGSEVIDPVLAGLRDRGAIDYLRVDGADRSTMRRLVREVDVVVDQVRSGFYGAAAVEAMVAGRIVVGYVAPDVRALVPDPIPVVDAPAARFAEGVAALLDDRVSWPAMIRTGSDFASRWHDGHESARVLCGALGLRLDPAGDTPGPPAS